MAQVQATTSFITLDSGVEVSIAAGDILDSDHAIVRNTPNDWWAPITSRFARAPEEATTKSKRTVKAAETGDAALD